MPSLQRRAEGEERRVNSRAEHHATYLLRWAAECSLPRCPVRASPITNYNHPITFPKTSLASQGQEATEQRGSGCGSTGRLGEIRQAFEMLALEYTGDLTQPR